MSRIDEIRCDHHNGRYVAWTVRINDHIAYLLDRTAALEAAVQAARDLRLCSDHADACCADWCPRCEEQESAMDVLGQRLAALDGVDRRGGGR